MSKRLSYSDFKEKACKVHGDKYDYSIVNYKGRKSKIQIICKEHGIFEQSPDSHFAGAGCGKCVRFINEELSRFILKELLNIDFKKIKFDFQNHKLELDGYNDKYKIAFEYNGVQHYELNAYIKNETDLKYRKYLDALKVQYCKINSIQLLVIPYTIKICDLQKFISHWLNEQKIKIINEFVDIQKFVESYSYTKNRYNVINDIVLSKGGIIEKYYFDKLTVKCQKNHVWTTSYSVIKNNHWCSKCSNVNSFDSIIKTLNKYNISCLSYENEYENGKSVLKFLCPNLHQFNFSVTRLLQKLDCRNRKMCPHCVNKHQNYALQKIQHHGLVPVNPDEYNNKKQIIEWKCINGTRQFNKLKNLMEKIRRGTKLCTCCN